EMEISEVLLITAIVEIFSGARSHLAKCLNDIALRHFTPGETLIFSKSYNEYRNNLQFQRKFLTKTDDVSSSISAELAFLSSPLEELHQQELWPLVLCNRQICDEFRHGTRSKHSSYIFSLQARDLIREIREKLTALKELAEWNPRAKFVVAVEQCYFFSRNVNAVVEEILTELWNWKIVNAVILIPAQNIQFQCNGNESHNKSSKRQVSEKLPIPLLEVFTWFPYQLSNLCGQVKRAILINTWVLDGEDREGFLHEIPLFGKKIPSDLRGCPVRVSAFAYSPFFNQDMNNGKHKDAIIFNDGLEFSLLKTMIAATNISVTFQPLPVGDDLWGRPLKNGSWTGILGQVLSGNSEVAVCGLYYVCHLSNGFECSMPYIFDETLWYIPCPKPFPHWMSLSRVFDVSLWLVFILVYVIYSTLIWVSVMLYNMQGNVQHPCTSISKCFLNLWAIILGVSAYDKSPEKTIIRVSFLLWVMYSLALNSVYQTFLTSFLIDPGLEREISTVEELLESEMELGIPTTVDTVLPELTSSRYWRHTLCPDMSLCFRRLAYEGNFAVLCSRYSTEYDEGHKYIDSNGKSHLCHLKQTFSLQSVTMTVQKGSLLLEKFNAVISHVIEAGLMNLWWKDLKFLATLRADKVLEAPNSEYTAMTMEHFQSAFFVLAFGSLLAVLCFVWEFLH
ncbi:hypothetical protein B7P43_G13529, partial [Cryptotermes secundus]